MSARDKKKVLNMKEPYEMYCEAECMKPDDKNKNVKHFVEVSIPVDFKPETKVGRIEAELCGEPVVMCDECKKKPDACRLVIAQKVCIKIPVKYSFRAEAGESITDCCGCMGE